MRVVIENLTKSYGKNENKILVLKDISFEILEGDFISVVGPSGCGKSTLLKCIAGLVNIDSGNIRFENVNGKGRPLTSMVFQEFALFPWRNVLQNICFGLEELKVSKAKRMAIAQEYVNMMKLQGFERFYPCELSGGMKQRVAVARAMAVKPWLLLMDEPMASLDAITAQRLQLELMEIIYKGKQSVIYVTHSIPEAVFLSDRILVMTARPGRIKEIVEVDVKRPRDKSFKLSAEFLNYLEMVWKFLDEDK